MLTGTVKFYHDGRGFAFIQRDDGQGDVFAHFSALADPRDYLAQGARVSFEMGTDERKGKPCAKNIRVLK